MVVHLDPPGDLALPQGPSLRGILPDVARGLGAQLPELASAGLALPASRRAVVVVVDGLGWEALLARAGHAPTLRALMRDQPDGWRGRATCGYPSTTAASLASFGTGLTPGETGMLGYTVKEPGAGLVNLVSWSAGEGRTPPDPVHWQPHPTVFERIAQQIRCVSVGRGRFAGSGLTMAALRGSEFRPAEGLQAHLEAALHALRTPGLVYLYWGWLDHTGHRLGWSAPEWGEDLGALDGALGELLRRAPRGTTVTITADHGMVDVTERIDVADDAALRAEVALVAGEPRAMHLHLTPGADADSVARRWQDRLGDRAWVMVGGEAVAGGLFGVVSERTPRCLIGDVVVAMRATSAVVDSRTQPPNSLRLVGMHGSLTPAERDIPALIALC